MANSAIFLLLFHFTDHLRGRLRVIKSLADFAIALTRINKNWNKLVSYESFPHKQQASTLRLNSHRLQHQENKRKRRETGKLRYVSCLKFSCQTTLRFSRYFMFYLVILCSISSKTSKKVVDPIQNCSAGIFRGKREFDRKFTS